MPSKFPFDIQHRGIIVYSSDSSRDFERLEADITRRLEALIAKQATSEQIAASPVKGTQGLDPHEIATLALVMANIDSPMDSIHAAALKRDMESAGYTKLATQLALANLSRMLFIEVCQDSDFRGNEYTGYRILPAGEDWLLSNRELLELRSNRTIEVPF